MDSKEKQMKPEDDLRYPVEQVSNNGEPTQNQVKAAVKNLNPDQHSMGSRG